jgi:hypothetical protein
MASMGSIRGALWLENVNENAGSQQVASAAWTKPPPDKLLVQFRGLGKRSGLEHATSFEERPSLCPDEFQSDAAAAMRDVRVIELGDDGEETLHLGEIPSCVPSAA